MMMDMRRELEMEYLPTVTESRKKWLEALEKNPLAKCQIAQTAFACRKLGWTEWVYTESGEPVGEVLTDAGRDALYGSQTIYERKPVDIGWLEIKYNDLIGLWEKNSGLMMAMLNTKDNGIYCYDMLGTLRSMSELYVRIAAHVEVLKHAKGEY